MPLVRDTYTYLASPYSSHNKAEMTARFFAVEAATAWMLKSKIWTYSPIVHCHEIAGRYQIPTDFEYWTAYNFAMMRGADAFAILTIDGWQASAGVAGELAYATEQLHLPLFFLNTNGNDYALVEAPAF